jgi:DNA-directed RNA polymerase subunit L
MLLSGSACETAAPDGHRNWGYLMALKFKFPSQEEQTFCNEVNAILKDHGARVVAFEIQHPDDSLSYHLTFECTSKRKTIHSDVPFHYDPPEAVAQRVTDWIAGVRQANRWTTEVPADLD